MRTIKYLVFTFLLLFITCDIVRAESCDSNDIKRLKEIAKNVTVSYEYDEDREKFGIYGSYVITVDGLTDELYATAIEDANTYYFNYDSEELISYNLSSSVREITVFSSNCDEKIRTIDLKLPYYNFYYTYDECNGISGDDLYVCSKFLDEELSYSKFLNEIKKYKSNHDDLDKDTTNFFEKYKLYFIGVFIVAIIIIAIVCVRKYKEKNVLD